MFAGREHARILANRFQHRGTGQPPWTDWRSPHLQGNHMRLGVFREEAFLQAIRFFGGPWLRTSQYAPNCLMASANAAKLTGLRM